MPVYCKFFREKQIILRGPITKAPYKDWFELESANWASGRSTSSGTSRARESPEKSLYTDVAFTTGFHELVTFALSRSGSEPFSVQIDFVDSANGQQYLTITLSEALISSVNISGNNGVPVVSGTFSATSIEYVYIGAANDGSPSVTVKRKGA